MVRMSWGSSKNCSSIKNSRNTSRMGPLLRSAAGACCFMARFLHVDFARVNLVKRSGRRRHILVSSRQRIRSTMHFPHFFRLLAATFVLANVGCSENTPAGPKGPEPLGDPLTYDVTKPGLYTCGHRVLEMTYTPP